MRAPLLAFGLLAALGCSGPDGSPSVPITSPPPADDVPVKPSPPAPVPAPTTPAPVLPRIADGAPFSIVVLPDTQFYAEYYPEIFEAQTRWIVANQKSHDIRLVLHEGDIVNGPEDVEQWRRAAKSLRMLDDVVPYAAARGNHDLVRGVSRAGGFMEEFFPASRYLRHAWFRETFEVGKTDNTFLLVEINGQKWAILSLEFGPRDEVLAWADGVLARHPDAPAIVVTHAYLYSDNTRYNHKAANGQLHGPHESPLEGGANDGEEMWQKLISKHDNVMFVLSGHVPDDGTGVLTSVRPSGAPCHQILANYQSYGQGGDGFLRILRFEPAQRRLVVRTYSPHLNQYKNDADNQFALDLP